MKKFFKNWGVSLVTFFIFFVFLFWTVRFVILNHFVVFIPSEYEFLLLEFGYLIGLLVFSIVWFIGSLIGDIINFVRQKFDNRNHLSEVSL